MMDFRQIDKAVAVITYDTEDTRRYVNKCDEFDMEPSWIGKTFINSKNNFKFELKGLRRIRSTWMLIVKDINNSTEAKPIYNMVSLREFFEDCI